MSSAIGMNSTGLDCAKGGMVPTKQGFDANDFPAPGIDKGLELQAEGLLCHGVAQFLFDQVATPCGRIERFVEEAIAVATIGLGAIERQIGIAHQRVGLPAIERRACYTDADPDAGGAARQGEGPGKAGNDAFGEVGGLSRIGNAGLDDGEFIAAKPGDSIELTCLLLQCLGDLLQQFVAGAVAVIVIHLLEAVEVQQQHREALIHAFKARDGAGEVFRHHHPIAQVGQGIVTCQILDPAACFLRGGDVATDTAVTVKFPSLS